MLFSTYHKLVAALLLPTDRELIPSLNRMLLFICSTDLAIKEEQTLDDQECNFEPEFLNVNDEHEGENAEPVTYFTTKSGYKVQLRICLDCGRSFHRPAKLKAHALKHHGTSVEIPRKPVTKTLKVPRAEVIDPSADGEDVERLKNERHVSRSLACSSVQSKQPSEYFITKFGNRVLLHNCQECGRSFHRPAKLRAHVQKCHESEDSSASETHATPSKGEGMDSDCSNARQEESDNENLPQVSIVLDNICKRVMAKHNNPASEYFITKFGNRVRLHNCHECGRSFHRPAKLRAHMLKWHEMLIGNVDNSCIAQKSKDEEMLIENSESPSKEQDPHDEKIQSDEEISWEANEESQLEPGHLETSTKYYVTKFGNKVLLHDCQECGRSFHRPVKLRAHMLSYHPNSAKIGPKPTKRKSFAVGNITALPIETTRPVANVSAQSSAQYFVTKTGYKVRLHLCQECGRSFHRPAKLRAHMLRYHKTAVMATLPPNDPESSQLPTDLEDIATSHPAVPVTKYFTTKSGDRVLLRKCQECDRYFHRPSKLREHMVIRHGQAETPGLDRRFYCEHCGKCYRREQSLKYHIKNSHGEGSANRGGLLHLSQPALSLEGKKTRVYTCPHCGYKFLRTNFLRNHLFKRHNIHLPYKSQKLGVPTTTPAKEGMVLK